MKRRASGPSFSRRKRKVNTGMIKEIGIWTGEILLVIVTAVILVSFIGFRISVVGPSMSSTLENGQEILVNRLVYQFFSPKANDLIVFRPNGNEKSHYYIKRVIACPGDKVQIIKGQVYVNGEPFTEIITAASIENALLAEEEITVKEDEYFVLGDNRNNSEDSRYASIGNVKKEHITGKAWFVISPWKKIGFVK